MKILYIHNDYFRFSGEEHAAEGLVNLLRSAGHEIEWYRRSSVELGESKYKRVQAFLTGVYNPNAVDQVKQKIMDFRPNIVQIQNLYPLISPGILPAIKKMGIPIVMRCPNYRLFCPNGLHLDTAGHVCEQCLGPGRELNCIRKNCERSILKSMGYALRNFTARTIWKIHHVVDAFIVQSSFQKEQFIKNGIPADKISVLPGLAPKLTSTAEPINEETNYVTFVGRASVEKGITEFVAAAQMLPSIPFAVAGNLSQELQELQTNSPDNLQWKGFLNATDLDKLYQSSRIIVVPSKWYEGFPNVITRGMMHARPVISSNIGAMSTIVDHEKSGLLCPPGDAKALVGAIQSLYPDLEKCQKMGSNGQEKATRYYSNESLLQTLVETYNKALHNPLNAF